MFLKLTAGILVCMGLLALILKIQRPENAGRVLLLGMAAALAADAAGQLLGITAHLKGWLPAGSLLSAAFSAWITKGLIMQGGKYIILRDTLNRSEEEPTRFDLVVSGALCGIGFGFCCGLTELFDGGSLFIGTMRQILPVHFAAGIWTAYIYGTKSSEGRAAAAWLLPALAQGLYEFLVNDRFSAGLLLIPSLFGITAAAAVCGLSVLCLMRWKNRKFMNQPV